MDGGTNPLSLALLCALLSLLLFSPRDGSVALVVPDLKKKKERKVLKKRQKRQKEKVQIIQFPKAKRLRRHIASLTS